MDISNTNFDILKNYLGVTMSKLTISYRPLFSIVYPNYMYAYKTNLLKFGLLVIEVARK